MPQTNVVLGVELYAWIDGPSTGKQTQNMELSHREIATQHLYAACSGHANLWCVSVELRREKANARLFHSFVSRRVNRFSRPNGPSGCGLTHWRR